MAEHVHGCLNCRPDMVPDFERSDPRYHDAAKCGRNLHAFIDGIEIAYTRGIFEGREGWVLHPGTPDHIDLIHDCPNCTTYHTYQGYQVVDHHEVCVEPRFGSVTVEHR